MSEHKPHTDAVHDALEAPESSAKGPHDPDTINPKLASDIHYWAQEFHVTGQILHEAIRVHGTSVAKVRAALAAKSVHSGS